MKHFTFLLFCTLAASIKAKQDLSSELDSLLGKLERLQQRVPSLVDRIEQLEKKASSQKGYIEELKSNDRRLQTDCTLNEVAIGEVTQCELAASLILEADAELNGTLTVEAETVEVVGKLYTDGPATVWADVVVESTFEITEDLDLHSTESATTPRFEDNLYVYQDATVAGTAELQGDVDFVKDPPDDNDSDDDFIAAVTVGSVLVSGQLDLEGETTIFNDIVFDGEGTVRVNAPVVVEDEGIFEQGSGDYLDNPVDINADLTVDELVINEQYTPP